MSPEPTTTRCWQEFRDRMPVVAHWAYFDHAAVAPLSGPAGATLEEWSADVLTGGGANWGAWRKRLEETRSRAAALLGADRSEIALIRNTTEGINLVAEGFPWQAGDNVVVPADEFPSNLYPWMNLADRGVEVRLVPAEDERLDLDRLDAACDERTRIVAVSWVGYATGWRNDVDALAEIAHRHGAYLFLDAIQGLGVFPLDMAATPVDFLAADGHKWLLGPEGAGLFYLRREHLNLLRPVGVGWNSVQQAGNFADTSFTLKDSAGRYEGGTYNMGGLAALGASLEMLLEYGIDAVSRRVLEVTDQLCERLRAVGGDIVSSRENGHGSGIVSFALPGHDSENIRRRCRDEGVLVNCRNGRVRVSPHAYTNDEDIERLVGAVAGLDAKTQSREV